MTQINACIFPTLSIPAFKIKEYQQIIKYNVNQLRSNFDAQLLRIFSSLLSAELNSLCLF
jgi:hypothetical protein